MRRELKNDPESRLRRIWKAMRRRCLVPHCKGYRDYGGRGISICGEWIDNFDVFYGWAVSNGYQSTLSIERVNNDGNYEPSNCTWATIKEQNNNMRRSVRLTYNGETKTASQWAESIGMKKCAFFRRLKVGYTMEMILNIPLSPKIRYIEYKGEIKRLYEWASIFGIKRETLAYRLNIGMSMDEAVNQNVLIKTGRPKTKQT